MIIARNAKQKIRATFPKKRKKRWTKTVYYATIIAMKFDEVNLLKCTTLAYVGDSVFSLYVRSVLSRDLTLPTRELMKRSARFVSAVVQARIFDKLFPALSEEEQALMVRCKNAHVNNRAKNATMGEYKKATALEGLLGALYLSGDNERLDEILDKCMEIAYE